MSSEHKNQTHNWECEKCGNTAVGSWCPFSVIKSGLHKNHGPNLHGDISGDEFVGTGKRGSVAYGIWISPEGFRRIDIHGGSGYSTSHEVIPTLHVSLCRKCIWLLQLKLLALRIVTALCATIVTIAIWYGVELLPEWELSDFFGGVAAIMCVITGVAALWILALVLLQLFGIILFSIAYFFGNEHFGSASASIHRWCACEYLVTRLFFRRRKLIL